MRSVLARWSSRYRSGRGRLDDGICADLLVVAVEPGGDEWGEQLRSESVLLEVPGTQGGVLPSTRMAPLAAGIITGSHSPARCTDCARGRASHARYATSRSPSSTGLLIELPTRLAEVGVTASQAERGHRDQNQGKAARSELTTSSPLATVARRRTPAATMTQINRTVGPHPV